MSDSYIVAVETGVIIDLFLAKGSAGWDQLFKISQNTDIVTLNQVLEGLKSGALDKARTDVQIRLNWNQAQIDEVLPLDLVDQFKSWMVSSGDHRLKRVDLVSIADPDLFDEIDKTKVNYVDKLLT